MDDGGLLNILSRAECQSQSQMKQKGGGKMMLRNEADKLKGTDGSVTALQNTLDLEKLKSKQPRKFYNLKLKAHEEVV